MALDRTFFFDSVRESLFGGKLTQEQVNGMSAILDEWQSGDNCDDRQLAYMLATTFHETAATMQPIDERGSDKYFESRYGFGTKMARVLGNMKFGDGALYHGRGYVQLTGRSNYAKAGKITGADLLTSPDRAKEREIAAQILFAGMTEGWFTGKKLADYFNDTQTDWVNARRVINSTDRAELIAGYGRKFHAAISHAA